MTRSKAVLVVTVVALIFAGLASWGVYNYLQDETRKSQANAGAGIVVAAGDIPIGTKLDITQMKVASWPKTSIPQGSFDAPQLVAGRVVVRQLTTGDAITEQKLMPKEGTPGATGVMTYIVPQGHRAVTVGVNEVAGVAGFIAPNNRVDVVLTTPIPGTTTDERISKIILQNVPVLATGQISEQKEGKPVIVPTVTLDLTPEDSERLVLASHKGSLQLLLRSIIDTAPVEAKGATISKVLSGTGGYDAPVKVAVAPVKPVKHKATRRAAARAAAPTAAAPSRRTSHTVIVIDGAVRTSKEFVLQ